MLKSGQFDDAEVRSFIDQQPRIKSFTAMADDCLKQFGAERAWSRSKIVRYWQAERPTRKGHHSKVEADPEVKAFVDDRLGRLTLDEVIAECAATFAASRVPSRSGLHRYWDRLRKQRE